MRQRKPVDYNEDKLAAAIEEKKSKAQGKATAATRKGPKSKITKEGEPLPKVNAHGELNFGSKFAGFHPNLTPKQVMQLGSFGGTYYRIIDSGVVGERLRDQHKEFPAFPLSNHLSKHPQRLVPALISQERALSFLERGDACHCKEKT